MGKRLYISCILLVVALPATSSASPVVFQVGGSDDPASIQATVDVFRAALGSPNNGNAPGPLPAGRREINWDGGGSVINAPVGTPFDGFMDSRGARFVTPGTGFVQAPASAGGGNDDLGTFFGNPTYDGIFGSFSPQRLFAPVGSNITDVHFFVPGTVGGVAAEVSGFGAVFSDVDLADSAELQFFDTDGNLLYADFVSEGTVGDASLSFLGVVFDGGERVSRVRITSGTQGLGGGSNDDPLHGTDLVAMDDFLYSEPLAAAHVVPEPAAWVLFVAGAMAIFAVGAIRPRLAGAAPTSRPRR